jgi:formamidopyrimidine-DNA glycosylase
MRHTPAMPELPEVETVARDLQRLVAGATIVGASVHWARTIRHPQPPERFVAEVAGATVRRVSRRAKTVLLHLEDGRVMTVALRMTGALIVTDAATPADPYARVVFALADGRELRYRDVRKFGRIGLWPGGGLRSVGAGRGARSRRVAEGGRRYRIGEVFSGHGPEPLQRGFTSRRFAERLGRRSAKLKSLLLDQTFIAGVGNIYADEALWRARLHPLRTADSLDAEEIARLHRAVRAVLRAGVENRGSSFSDYVGADGEPGANAERLVVYRRTDQPCYRCGRPIRRIVVGQRSTHFCPRCQPERAG